MSKFASKHSRLMRILRGRILRGAYPKKLPSERALAQELGTDPRTVYVALAQLEALGLVRRTERKGTVAVPPVEHPRDAAVNYVRLILSSPFDEKGRASFWSSVMLYGFQRSAQEHHINLTLGYSDSVEDEVEKAVRESRAAGCVGTCLMAMRIETKHALRLAEASGPVVVADWTIEEPVVPYITFDNLDAGRQAAEHLVKLGHRRIAHVNREEPGRVRSERQAGVETYLKDVGLALSDNIVFRGDPIPALAKVIARSDRPTAIITVYDTLAEILMAQASSHGLRVPGDLSIITYCETRMRRATPFTAVAMDHEALGRRALEALLDDDLWENPRRVLLPVKLADFGTTAPPPVG